MSRNLFDFGNENLNDNILSEEKKEYSNSSFNEDNKYSTNSFSNNNFEKNGVSEEAVKEMYEKYKDYSQNDLTKEFLSTSKQKLKEGSLTQEKINSTANALLPFLNDDQKEMMYKLLEKLND